MEKQTSKETVSIQEIEKHFDRVIGYKSIKRELIRICDIMRNEHHYASLGVSVPNGLLLEGVPGIGKTLMAKCLIKASMRTAFVCRKDLPDGDFVKHIKGVFGEAVKNAPSIVFLDDMDKFANCDDSHKNSEEFITIQSCMDDVKGKNVFVVATINEDDAIPKSLLRAGRFDYRIKVHPPKGKDAEKIVEYYIKQKKFVAGVDVKTIARLLDTASCAEFETVINEAGIYAGEQRKTVITMDDIVKACVKVIYGAPENDGDYSEEQIKTTAYHEAGHAVIAEVLEPGSVNFISVRRGQLEGKLGFTDTVRNNDYYFDKKYMENKVMILLGGKASTEICFGKTDLGVSSDMRSVFNIVDRFMDDYCTYGFDAYEYSYKMSDKFYANKEEKMACEISKFYEQTKRILIENREFLDRLAKTLMTQDVVMGAQVIEIREACKKASLVA